MNVEAVEAIYHAELAHPERAITAHLPRLRALAEQCDDVVEFGVKRGASSAALILGAKGGVWSYDILRTPQADHLQTVAAPKWAYTAGPTTGDSRCVAPRPCDLLFIDSLHTLAQLQVELDRHAGGVRRFLVFHDTITFGSLGADGETGRWSWTPAPGQSVPREHLGIRPAIDELMIADPSWHITQHYTDSHGLLVVERR